MQKRGVRGFYRYFILTVWKWKHYLFPRWIAKGADFHGEEEGMRESEFKKREEL